MSIWTQIKIWWYKRRLRRIMLALYDAYDDYSCGSNLARSFSHRIARLEGEKEDLYTILRKLDPEFPL